MTSTSVTGFKEADDLLQGLERRTGRAIGRKAINRGLTVLVKSVRSNTTVGKTKAMRKSVGKRNKKNRRKGIQEAKVGYNVGAKRAAKKRARHSHLVAAGTKERVRKKVGGLFSRAAQKTTGRVKPNNAVSRAESQAGKAALKVMSDEIVKGIEKVK